MADILYILGKTVYINITNTCPCKCEFCIRQGKDGVGSADSLWFESDPTIEEIISAIKSFDFNGFSEIVFCGYGEPLCALENLLLTAKYLRENYALKIRLNTNGLGDLVNKKQTAPLLRGLIDSVSVSLNASDAEKYCDIVHPAFGLQSFDAMLEFAKECKNYVSEVVLSIVDVVPAEEIEKCKAVAEKAGVPLRIREYDENSN